MRKNKTGRMTWQTLTIALILLLTKGVSTMAQISNTYLVQLLKGFHHRVQVVTVQRAETFIDKQHIHRKTFPVE